jgi:hypothetical protein
MLVLIDRGLAREKKAAVASGCHSGFCTQRPAGSSPGPRLFRTPFSGVVLHVSWYHSAEYAAIRETAPYQHRVQSSFRMAFVCLQSVNSTIPWISVKMARHWRVGRHIGPGRFCHGWHVGTHSTDVGAGFSGGEGQHPCDGVGGLGPEDPASLRPDRGDLPPVGDPLELLFSRMGRPGIDGPDA